jgi:hypothetical protein
MLQFPQVYGDVHHRDGLVVYDGNMATNRIERKQDLRAIIARKKHFNEIITAGGI